MTIKKNTNTKKNTTTEKRASAGRLKQGACPLYEFTDNGHRQQVKGFQYPSGTTTDEKLAMLEERFKEFFREASRDYEWQQRSRDDLLNELNQLRKQHNAALQLVRTMIPDPRQPSEFDDGIPF